MPRKGDTLRGLAAFKTYSRARKLIALVPPSSALSDVDSQSDDDTGESKSSSSHIDYPSPAPSIDSSLERINISESENEEILDSDETDIDIEHFRKVQTVVEVHTKTQSLHSSHNENSKTKPTSSKQAHDSQQKRDDTPTAMSPANKEDSVTNPISSMQEDDSKNKCNDIPVALSPIIRKVLPSVNEVNYDEIPSLSSLLSVPPTPKTEFSSVRKTRSKRSLPMPPRTSSGRAKKQKKSFVVTYKWSKAQFKHKADIPSDDFVFNLPDTESPMDYFLRYFSPDILEHIVAHTNLYSVQRTGKSINITIDDLKDFLSILLLMGIVVMPSYLDYWSDELRYAQIANTMSLKRFQQIRRNLHFVDNNTDDGDKYHKIRPFVEKVRINCLKTEEETRFSIDEMTIPYKGNKAGNRKQYNPNKPDKWGYKALVRAGASGIVYDFLLYGGEDTFRYIQFTEREEQMTLGAKIVLALCKTIQTPGCAVYFDNYFTTLDLIWHLRENYGIFSLGTIRQNRLKGCNDHLTSDKVLKKKGRGSFSQVVDNDKKISVVKWLDNKVVTLASSFADAYPVQKIKRWKKEHKQKIDVQCPQLVHYYNQHMGGVDLCDMLVSLYRTSYKSRRWYMNIFAQLLDICVNNAWLLYRRKCTSKKLKNISLKSFRQRLAKELQLKGRQTDQHNKENASAIRNPRQPRPEDSIRYDGYHHWPVQTSKGRCKYCHKYTNIECSKCKQRLCLVKDRNCFYDFHHK